MSLKLLNILFSQNVIVSKHYAGEVCAKGQFPISFQVNGNILKNRGCTCWIATSHVKIVDINGMRITSFGTHAATSKMSTMPATQSDRVTVTGQQVLLLIAAYLASAFKWIFGSQCNLSKLRGSWLVTQL